MARKYKKHSGCKASSKVAGRHMSVKASCPIKKGTKVVARKAKTVRRKTKHTSVPASCKGLKKRARKECAKRVCSQRPAEYRDQCFKKAGIRV